MCRGAAISSGGGVRLPAGGVAYRVMVVYVSVVVVEREGNFILEVVMLLLNCVYRGACISSGGGVRLPAGGVA
jgi:hypothetical protein